MITKTHAVLADPRILPGDPHLIGTLLSGLSGAALFAAIVGGVLGYALAWKVDDLPAIVGIGLGAFGGFTVVSWLLA